MAASPQTVSTTPLYLNARTNLYTANELRKPWDNAGVGPGAADNDSFRVRQRVAGANMSVDCVAASILNRAWVRATSTVASGVSASADAGLYLVDYNSATILNLDIAAADAVNPRIDSIFLAVEDAQGAGTNNLATVRVVTGTPTGGATLDNRTGAGATPAGMGSILLADVLVPALSATVVTANIRDRRPVGVSGTVPWAGALGTQIDAVTPVPHPAVPLNGIGPSTASTNMFTAGTHDSMQAVYAGFLSRRIVSAARVRFKYLQGGTAAATNYVVFVMDASGRVILQTAATAFTGAANTAQLVTPAFTSSLTLEAGWYYLGLGVAPMTAASWVLVYGVSGTTIVGNNGPGALVPNVLFRGTGGTTIQPTLAGMTGVVDFSAAAANASMLPIPLFTIST